MLEIYINPYNDILLINLDSLWNVKGEKRLINHHTNSLNLNSIFLLLKELKFRRYDERTKVYDAFVSILTKDITTIEKKEQELKDMISKDKNNLSALIGIIMIHLAMLKKEEVQQDLKIIDNILH